jgi:glycosyltransferase involved in cell wall biosynthesis
LLTNCLPMYRVPLFEHIKQRAQHLRVFLSIKVVADRDWHLFWGDLDVITSRSFTWVQTFRNSHGFVDQSVISFPYDTLWALWRYRPDVLVSSEFGVRTLFAAIYKALFPQTKLFIWATLSEHTEATRSKKREVLRRQLLRFADGVFVNGASGERYIRSLGFRKGPICAVPYTIDNRIFRGATTRRGGGPIRLLFTGQLVERKGLYSFFVQLVRWCEDHPSKAVVLSVVGSGPELERLQSIKPSSNLEIRYEGVASFQQLPRYYHEADIYIFPTLADEWGVVVNEAMIAGLPILGSRYSQAVEELVQDGVNGWTFTPMDEEDTYHALDRALQTDSAGLDVMRRRAVDAVSELTPQVMADRMIATIQQVAGC